MEEHLRQLVIEADAGLAVHVADAPQRFQHQQPSDARLAELLRIADGVTTDSPKYAEIRFMTAKDAMAELRRLADGAGLELPPRLNTALAAPEF